MAVDPHTHFAYVVSPYRRTSRDLEGNILVISGTQVIQNIKLSGQAYPTEVVADPIGGYVYAGGLDGNVIVFKGLQEVARYKIPSGGALGNSLDVDYHTGEVYAFANEKLYRFKGGRLIDSANLIPDMGNVYGIRVHPVTESVYISHTGYVLGETRILLVQNMKVVEDIRVGGLSAMTADPLTENLYVTNFGDGADADTVMIINGAKVLAKIQVGLHPYNISINTANGWVYVSNINDGTVTVLGYPQSKSTAPTLTGTTPVIPNRPTAATYP